MQKQAVEAGYMAVTEQPVVAQEPPVSLLRVVGKEMPFTDPGLVTGLPLASPAA